MAWECMCCTSYHDFPSSHCTTCRWPNSNHKHEYIRNIILPTKQKVSATGNDKDCSTDPKYFVLRKIPKPKGNGQLDIRAFLQNKKPSTSMSRHRTDSMKTASPQIKCTSKKPSGSCGSHDVKVAHVTTERCKNKSENGANFTSASESASEPDRKPAACTVATETIIYIKHMSHGQTTYIPIEMNTDEQIALPHGVYLTNDTDGLDPNRIILHIGDEAEEVPDFVLDAIPFDED